MKRILMFAVALLGTMSAASAAALQWTPGWDLFAEPLDFASSGVTFSVNQTTKIMRVSFTLKGAVASKLYQVGLHIVRNKCPAHVPTSFGQFPILRCTVTTRQGVTKAIMAVEFGVVTTDISGNGAFSVAVGPIVAGTYGVEFHARNGAGCNLIGNGGTGGSGKCSADFQSLGPTFGDTRAIVVQ